MLEENEIKFIGPSANLIKMMGDKIQAKKVAKENGLPVIEGSEGGVNNITEAKEPLPDAEKYKNIKNKKEFL